jgi:hypothetical protein
MSAVLKRVPAESIPSTHNKTLADLMV